MSSAPFGGMSGASNMNGIRIQKPGTEFDRNVPAFPFQSHSEYSAIPSKIQVKDANETFRQEWQAIVGSLHAADQASGDKVHAGDSLGAAGASVSFQEPVVVAADKSKGIQDIGERATGELVFKSASTANSIALHPAIAPKTFPMQAAVHAGPDRPTSKERGENSASHATQSSLKSDQFDSQQLSNIQTISLIAPYSEFGTVTAIAPKPAIVLTTAQTPEARSSATEFTNRKGDSSVQDAGLAGSVTVTGRSHVTSRQPTLTTGVFKSEEQTAPATVSSQLSTERTDQVFNGPSEYVSSHKPRAVVEQARPSTPGELTPRFVLSGESNATFANKGSTRSGETTEFTLDQEVQINQPSIGPLKTDAVRRAQAGIVESPLYSKAKIAAAPLILNQTVSDASAAAVGQTHGASAPLSSAAWTATLQGPDAAGMRPGKTAPAHEAFAAMDAGMNDGSAKWIIADSHRAEAGFQDPALGWISIRAQAGPVGIHATVLPSSETAAEVLSGHLAGLNAHIANHYEHMNTVTVSFPGTGWNGAGRETSQGNDRGSSQNDRQQAQENSGPMKSEPVRQFANDLKDEPMSTHLPVFTAGMNLQESHFSVVV
jgi:hypothetical protein